MADVFPIDTDSTALTARMSAKDGDLLTALLEHDASGWIPEIHLDDCEDDACQGCDPQHLAEVAAAEAGTADAMFEAADTFAAVGDMQGRAVASLLRDMAVAAHALEAARIRLGMRAEYGHILHDADPDAFTRPFPDLCKGIPARLIDGGRS